MVTLSIIVPVYNKVAYIDECIQSILTQTFTGFELILVNDGSTDGSDEKCRLYAAQDHRIVFVDQANQGVSAARNAGLGMARGEYIGFVDSDDSISSDLYAVLLRNAEETQAEISCCRLNVVKNGKSSSTPRRSGRQTYQQENALTAFFKGVFDFNVNNKIYKASLLHQLHFEGKMYEDILFVFKALLKANRVVLEHAALYNYIIRSNSVSMGTFGKVYFETTAVSARMLMLLNEKNQTSLAAAKAFDVMANLSILNLLLLLRDRSAYAQEFDQTVARLSGYHTFIKSDRAVRKKHRYAWLLFTISPRIYTHALRMVCQLTQSDALKRTR